MGNGGCAGRPCPRDQRGNPDRGERRDEAGRVRLGTRGGARRCRPVVGSGTGDSRLFHRPCSADGSAAGVAVQSGDPGHRSPPRVGRWPDPVLLRQTARRPAYPAGAREAGLEGTVCLRFLVDYQGIVRRVDIVYESPPDWGFAEAAIETVLRYRFRPASVLGNPGNVWSEGGGPGLRGKDSAGGVVFSFFLRVGQVRSVLSGREEEAGVGRRSWPCALGPGASS
jgi:TonB family protein